MSRRSPRSSTDSNVATLPRRTSTPPRTRARTTTTATRGSSKRASSTSSSRATSRTTAPSRSSTRWLQRALIAALVIASLMVAGQWVLHRSFLSVQHVDVHQIAHGASHETTAEILRVSGLGSHPAMIDVSDASVVRRLERLPWVRSVSVLKRWPSTVVLTITERQVVAVAYDAHHRLELVDASGRALAFSSGGANFPLLEATSAHPSATWPFGTWARAAAEVAGALPRAFQSQVAVVSVARDGVVSLKLTSPLTFVLGPPTQLRDKFTAVAAVIAHGTLHAGDVVDVTVPGTLTVSGP